MKTLAFITHHSSWHFSAVVSKRFKTWNLGGYYIVLIFWAWAGIGEPEKWLYRLYSYRSFGSLILFLLLYLGFCRVSLYIEMLR
ncbi:hypothetical protein BDV19DRAFT_350977 [Aspergillus venezuelensis]